MKPSNILFASILAAMLLLASVPQILGFMKMHRQGKPADFLSKFWFDHSGKLDGEHFLPPFHYIKIDGDGNGLELSLNRGVFDSIKVNRAKASYLELDVKNDTLFLKPLVSTGAYAVLQVPHKLAGIEVIHANVSGSIQQQMLSDMKWVVRNDSELHLRRPEHWSADTTQFLIPAIGVRALGKSRVFLDNFRIQDVEAKLDNSSLRYTKTMKVDTMRVTLKGKSGVSSITPYEEYQGVRVLQVSGDKKAFREQLIGVGVRLDLLP